LRSGAADALEWGTIADSVGYVRVNRLSGFTEDARPRPEQFDSLAAALDQMRSELATTSMLIVDVALNGGGSDAAAQMIAGYFADHARHVLTYETNGNEPQRIFVTPSGEAEHRPVLLLTSEVTASAAESFVLMMRAFPHVTHVGERTRGILSSLLPKPFLNGFRVTLSYQRVLDAEVNQYVGVVISPERQVILFPDQDLETEFARVLRSLARGDER
jgi:carboxyl-terminal processing protease